jgi:hypothetical protein
MEDVSILVRWSSIYRVLFPDAGSHIANIYRGTINPGARKASFTVAGFASWEMQEKN